MTTNRVSFARGALTPDRNVDSTKHKRLAKTLRIQAPAMSAKLISYYDLDRVRAFYLVNMQWAGG